jgi:hypothetical protein
MSVCLQITLAAEVYPVEGQFLIEVINKNIYKQESYNSSLRNTTEYLKNEERIPETCT